MRNSVPSSILIVSILAAASLLAACGDKDAADPGKPEAGESGLPTPQSPSGSVTGMPDAPGPGQGPANLGLPPDTPVASDGSVGLPPVESNPETGMSPGYPGTGQPLLTPEGLPRGEPGPNDAVDTIREYYANINARSFGRAYVLWSDNGGASGQSPQQFADSFADATGMSVEIQQPDGMETASGARIIKVPVAIAATQRDGSVRRYDGTFTLRYSVVDGAMPEQRNWRISSANLREIDQ